MRQLIIYSYFIDTLQGVRAVGRDDEGLPKQCPNNEAMKLGLFDIRIYGSA